MIKEQYDASEVYSEPVGRLTLRTSPKDVTIRSEISNFFDIFFESLFQYLYNKSVFDIYAEKGNPLMEIPFYILAYKSIYVNKKI